MGKVDVLYHKISRLARVCQRPPLQIPYYNATICVSYFVFAMHISWLGTTAMKLQTKPLNDDIIIVIDPYKPDAGVFPRSLTPNVALYTRGLDNTITISGDPFTLTTAGECDIKGVLITTVASSTPGHILLRIDTEQMSFGHLGLAKQPLTDKELEVIGGVDILCVPVGGNGLNCFDTEAAVKAVNAIEPRIVIPMAYRSDNDPKADGVELFLKEMGKPGMKTEPKIILKKKDLPQEETTVIVLDKE